MKRQRVSAGAEATTSPEAKRTRGTPAISVDRFVLVCMFAFHLVLCRLAQFKRQVRTVYDELTHADGGMGAPKERMEVCSFLNAIVR